MLLSKRVAIVTGGANGIGKGIARKFAEEGCTVAIADINEKDANTTVQEITNKGGQAIFVACNILKEQQVKDMVAKVVSKFGKLDILVNNAGGFGPQIPIQDLTEEEWDRCINLNLKGVFFCSKAVAPYMIEKHYGKIINMSSVSAISAGPPALHYGASKGAIHSMTLDLAIEFARHGICVNTIMPGPIRTDMWKTNMPPDADPDVFFRELGKNLVPLGRIGTPEDVAGAALFFASNLSDFITGDRLVVGGGLPLAAPKF
jgi:NAD(P)-dependent dehydrogenase (short-subunit alcohol dehydrogenase family)